MSYPWVRLETNVITNPKLLTLYGERKHRAALAYLLGLAYCGHAETDGYIPKGALGMLQATTADAAAIVAAGLWIEHTDGYLVPGWAEYQPTKAIIENGRESARKAVCDRWMRKGKPCSCGHH